MAQYIPAGRTSAIKKGEAVYQLQTEYARHPQPRITTTISSEGKVFHKIDKSIDVEVDSIERMHEVEDIIKLQHMEVSRVIRERGLTGDPEAAVDASETKIRSEQIRRLEGVKSVYLVSDDGRLAVEREVGGKFKKVYKHVFQELPEMLKVFAKLPGNRREKGIYEVEPSRIVLISTGAEFYLILFEPDAVYEPLSAKIKDIMNL